MQGEQEEHWKELCRQAVSEQDHDRLMEVVEQLNDTLEEKEQRLKQQRSTNAA